MKLWPTRINAADLVVILGEKKGIIIIILLLLSVFFFDRKYCWILEFSSFQENKIRK